MEVEPENIPSELVELILGFTGTTPHNLVRICTLNKYYEDRCSNLSFWIGVTNRNNHKWLQRLLIWFATIGQDHYFFLLYNNREKLSHGIDDHTLFQCVHEAANNNQKRFMERLFDIAIIIKEYEDAGITYSFGMVDFQADDLKMLLIAGKIGEEMAKGNSSTMLHFIKDPLKVVPLSSFYNNHNDRDFVFTNAFATGGNLDMLQNIIMKMNEKYGESISYPYNSIIYRILNRNEGNLSLLQELVHSPFVDINEKLLRETFKSTNGKARSILQKQFFSPPFSIRTNIFNGNILAIGSVRLIEKLIRNGEMSVTLFLNSYKTLDPKEYVDILSSFNASQLKIRQLIHNAKLNGFNYLYELLVKKYGKL
jgi:hypothetical protein